MNDLRSSPDHADLPLLDPLLSADESRRDLTICAILLAAGSSERFGEHNKLLEPIEGEPMVRRSVAVLLESTVDEIAVVVGHEADVVERAIAGIPGCILQNAQHDEGIGTSIHRGVEHAIRIDADAVLVSLADMPFVKPSTITRLIAAYGAGLGDPLAPTYRGKRGNPVLFGRQYFEPLRSVAPDSGGRDIITSSPTTARITTADPGIITDIDSLQDLDFSSDLL